MAEKVKNNPDPENPNARYFGMPYHVPRVTCREQSQSQRIRATQSRLSKKKPAKVTLPAMPESLRAVRKWGGW